MNEQQKRYSKMIGMITATGWLAWGIVVTKLDPYNATTIGLVLFFLSLTIALIGSFTLIGIGLRFRMNEKGLIDEDLTIALRQGILLSSCTVLAIALLIFGILKWWNGTLLILAMIGIEIQLTKR